MLNTQRNKYLETTVQTATPGQLLIMLYDGAIRNCRLAIESIRQSNNEDANRYLTRAQEIISEFMLTIDRSAEISENLLKLYEYFNYRLIQANIHKSIEQVEEVLGYLTELKETWIQAAKLAAQQSQSLSVQHG